MNTLYLGDNLPILQNLVQPIGIFIDAGNLYFIQQKIGKINFLKFKKLFPKKTNFFYFTASDYTNQKQQQNIEFYKKIGFKVFNKPLERNHYGNKGNLDVEITWGISKNYKKYKTLILVSGDGDFVYMLEDLQKNFNLNILVISTKGFIKKNLRENFDFVDIKNLNILKSIQNKKPLLGG